MDDDVSPNGASSASITPAGCGPKKGALTAPATFVANSVDGVTELLLLLLLLLP
jgi:hypothetical protein